ncbi:TPA: hypothetical protein DCX15_00025 [bacterium]|nr:hypothetical protein [bacterium]
MDWNKKNVKYAMILMVYLLFYATPLYSCSCCESRSNPQSPQEGYTELAKYVSVPFPKLKVSDDWLKGNRIEIPSELCGKTVSVLGTIDGKTLVATDKNIIYEISAVLKGNYSNYEERYILYNKRSLEDFIKPKPISIPFFESLNLPPFHPFTGGNIEDLGGSSSWSFPYDGVEHGIPILQWFDWTKDKLEIDSEGRTMAIFTIPIKKIKNNTSSTIEKLSLDFYLEGIDGKRYYAKEKLKIDKLLPSEEIEIKMEVKAPADDFSLYPFIDDGKNRLRLGKPLNWEEAAMKRECMGNEAECIEENLIKSLKYASTREGYHRILSRISFLWIRTGRYIEALSLIEESLKYDIDRNIKNFLKFQKIIALIKMHRLSLAVIELIDADEDVIPPYYQDYLIRNCLRQIEKEEAMAPLEKDPRYGKIINSLQKESQDEFKLNCLVTLFIEGIKDKIKSFPSAQGRYNEVRELYLQGRCDEAKLLLIGLLKFHSEEKIRLWDWSENFKVGPGALDMLGRIYLKEKNVSLAMDCFKKMVELYHDDYFGGPVEGEGRYGGPAGAEGLRYQICVLTNKFADWEGHSPNYDDFWFGGIKTPDYDTAIQLAHTLIKKFDGVVMPCWEFCPNYEEIAADAIKTSLENKNAPLEVWGKEIRKIIANTKNRALSADLLLTLGEKNIELDNIENAVKIYKEVIDQYSEVYSHGPDEDLRAYSLEALEELLKIYEKQGKSKELQAVRDRMEDTYKRISQLLSEEEEEYQVKELEDRFGKYVK